MSTQSYSHPKGYPASSYPSSKQDVNIIQRLCLGLTENKNEASHGIKVRYLINFYKAMTAVYILSLMKHYKNFSLGSFFYLALHGIYGAIWLLKDFSFPDRSFEKRVGFFGAVMHFSVLTGYWILPWLQMSGHGVNHPSSERIMFGIMLFTLGVVIMMTSDSQKYFTLRQREGLMTDGMYRFTRNPNYLGEMMVHASLAFATGSMIAWGVVGAIWTFFFIPRMIAKDVSLKQKAGADEYFKNTSILLPKFFFKNTILHYITWAVIIGSIIGIGEAITFTHFVKHPIKYISHMFK